MEVLLARIGVRGSPCRWRPVGHHLPVGTVLGPEGMGLVRSLPTTPSKVFPSLGAVETAEHIVEGPVLEQHHHDVVESVGPVWEVMDDAVLSAPGDRNWWHAPGPHPP